MHHTLRLPTALGALALSLAGATALADVEAHKALIGQPAPDFQADFAVNGKPVKLADLKGRVVLLTFWGAWAPTSREVLPRLQAWDEELKPKGLTVVGVCAYNPDFNRKIGFDRETGEIKRLNKSDIATDRQMLRDYAAAKGLTFLMMKLPKVEALHAYKVYAVKGEPQFVVIDRKGIVRMIRAGSTPAKLDAIEAEIGKLLKRK